MIHRLQLGIAYLFGRLSRIKDFGVKMKLSPVRAVLERKRVVVVDDLIMHVFSAVALCNEVGK